MLTDGQGPSGDVMTKKYNIVYKTENIITGKFYVGVHSTNSLQDGYIGCGIRRESDAKRVSKRSRFYNLGNAVVKYGYASFKRSILYFCETKEEAYSIEASIVTEEFVARRDTYNIKVGGIVPPSSIGIKRTKKFKQMISRSIKKYQDKLVDIHSKEFVFYNILEDKIYFVKNLANFCREYNIKEHRMRSVVIGKSPKTIEGWWGCHREEWTGTPVIRKLSKYQIGISGILCKEDKTVSFTNLQEAAAITNSDPSTLSKLVKGKVKSVKGWYLINNR